MDNQKLEQIAVGLALQALGKAEELNCIASVLVCDIVEKTDYVYYHEDALELVSAVACYHPKVYAESIFKLESRSYVPTCFTIASKYVARYALIQLVENKIFELKATLWGGN